MNSAGGCHERRVPFVADKTGVVTALAKESTDAYVVYENGDIVSWAEGEYATVSVEQAGASLVVGGRREVYLATDSPLRAAGRALEDLQAKGWRAYGWISFTLSHLLHGDTGEQTDGLLAYLAVPQREIRIGDGFALLRAVDEADLDSLEKRLVQAIQVSERPVTKTRVAVDTRYGGDAYREAVASVVDDIKAGRLDKLVLSRAVPVESGIDFPATYQAGRSGNAPARSFLFRWGGWEAAGFSPEIVVHVSADGAVITQPLAGTRSYEGDPAADLGRRRELYRDAKEVFEHAISVRLAAEELADVCAPGSIRVEDFMSVKERGSVQHLASQLSGRLESGRTAWDAVAALFPAVTASGIPKAAACAAIRDYEPGQRGIYSGAVLTVDADGTVDAALVLRTIFRRDGRVWLRAGAGIVAQSTPEREFEETQEKLRSVSRFLVPEAPADQARQDLLSETGAVPIRPRGRQEATL